MTEITIDDTHAPLIVVTFPRTLLPAQVRALFERYELLAQRYRKLGYVIDASRLDLVTSPGDTRGAFSEAFTAHYETLARCTVCEARITPSMLVRAALNAFDLLRPQKWPCAAFATLDEGMEWSWDHLMRVGVVHRRL